MPLSDAERKVKERYIREIESNLKIEFPGDLPSELRPCRDIDNRRTRITDADEDVEFVTKPLAISREMLEGLAMIAKIAPGRRDAVIKLLFGAMHKRQYMGPQVAYSQVKGLITKDCEVARKFVEKDQKGWFDRIENVFKIPDSYNAAIAANGHGNALAPGASGTTTESIATGDSKAAVGSVQLDDTATSVQVSNIPYEYRPMNHKEDKQPLINLKRNNSWLEVSASELPDKDMEKKRRLVFAQEIKAKKAHMRSMKYDAMERKTASYEEALDMFGVAYTMATELVEEHNAKKG